MSIRAVRIISGLAQMEGNSRLLVLQIVACRIFFFIAGAH